MFKGTLSVLVGFVIWFVAATLGNLLLRALIPTYIAVEPVMAFTVPMLLARLAVGFFSSLVAGFACSYVARPSLKPIYVLLDDHGGLLSFFLCTTTCWPNFRSGITLYFSGRSHLSQFSGEHRVVSYRRKPSMRPNNRWSGP